MPVAAAAAATILQLTALIVPLTVPTLLVIDGRTFAEFNSCHVASALNVCCSKLVQRRLQQDKVSVLELVQHAATSGSQVEAGGRVVVVVYDQRSPSAASLPPHGFVSVLLGKLRRTFSDVYLLNVCSRFAPGADDCFVFSQFGDLRVDLPAFQLLFPQLCENASRVDTRTPPLAQPVSSPSLHLRDTGPTCILPYLYLGSQRDVLNKEVMLQSGITHVLNASVGCPRPDFIPEGNFLRVPVHDSYCEKILPWLDCTANFIAAAASAEVEPRTAVSSVDVDLVRAARSAARHSGRLDGDGRGGDADAAGDGAALCSRREWGGEGEPAAAAAAAALCLDIHLPVTPSTFAQPQKRKQPTTKHFSPVMENPDSPLERTESAEPSADTRVSTQPPMGTETPTGAWVKRQAGAHAGKRVEANERTRDSAEPRLPSAPIQRSCSVEDYLATGLLLGITSGAHGQPCLHQHLLQHRYYYRQLGLWAHAPSVPSLTGPWDPKVELRRRDKALDGRGSRRSWHEETLLEKQRLAGAAARWSLRARRALLAAASSSSSSSASSSAPSSTSPLSAHDPMPKRASFSAAPS
ncbi:uncharacterized protein LOC133341614 [Lethenteron reissneri]|uniref:uncharacterized protein LOC133341614 n=1 Tax=Lethenteron reissneri TaxID=7753 RepID=UPI002AB795A2|nr:uncharacterized protein LOC133341614 [Lethenteron reissneri]